MIKKFTQIFPMSILTIALMACSNQTQPSSKTSPAIDIVSDVRTICQEVSKQYVYFEARSMHWPETCERAEKEATSLESKSAALSLFERMIDDLYDPHISLNANTQNSPRLVPSGSDIWFERSEKTYVASAIRPHSGAAKAGIQIGDELVRFNGLTPEALARTRIHSGTENLSEDRIIWALNAAVAGKRSDPRTLEIRRGDDVLSMELGGPEVSLPEDPVSYETPSEGIGYIRFHNSLGHASTVLAFNTALNALRQTDGLIIDLRETAGGGNTDVAEPIMGRFVSQKTAYQRTVLRNGSAQDRQIKPIGSWTYDKPVVVLVGRWTGSMGEGMAIGFDGMGRAKVMGSKMARLAGGTKDINLKEAGISMRLPAYDLHHLDGTPRHQWTPSEYMTADNGSQKDILLSRALLALQEK